MAFRNVDTDWNTFWNTFEMLVNNSGDNTSKNIKDTLESILTNGVMPEPEDLAGKEYHGYSTWWVTKPLGMVKFIKGFVNLDPKLFVGRDNPGVGVYNVQTEPNELDCPWIPKRGKDGQRSHFGYGDVYPADEDMYDILYLNSLLINYGLNPANSEHPVRNFRDYIVCAVGDNPSVLVGKSFTVFGPKGLLPIQFMNLPEIDSYIAQGALRSMSNYFVLIKDGESDSKMNKYFCNYEQTTRMVRE